MSRMNKMFYILEWKQLESLKLNSPLKTCISGMSQCLFKLSTEICIKHIFFMEKSSNPWSSTVSPWACSWGLVYFSSMIFLCPPVALHANPDPEPHPPLQEKKYLFLSRWELDFSFLILETDILLWKKQKEIHLNNGIRKLATWIFPKLNNPQNAFSREVLYMYSGKMGPNHVFRVWRLIAWISAASVAVTCVFTP